MHTNCICHACKDGKIFFSCGVLPRVSPRASRQQAMHAAMHASVMGLLVESVGVEGHHVGVAHHHGIAVAERPSPPVAGTTLGAGVSELLHLEHPEKQTHRLHGVGSARNRRHSYRRALASTPANRRKTPPEEERGRAMDTNPRSPRSSPPRSKRSLLRAYPGSPWRPRSRRALGWRLRQSEKKHSQGGRQRGGGK